MALTDTKIRKTKPTGKVQKLSDGGGLRLEITKAGTKVFKYRFKMDGKDSDHTIGEYPAISLLEARTLRDEARQLVKAGINPNDHKRHQKQQIAEQAARQQAESDLMTFSLLLDEFYTHKTKSYGDRKPEWALSTYQKHKLRFEKHVLPLLGTVPVVQINEQQLEDCLLRIQEHGTLENRDKVYSVFKLLFEYAKGKRYIDRDPALYISRALFVKHVAKQLKHVTTPKELKTVLSKLDAMRGTFEVLSCLRLGLHVFLRPSELVAMRWDEVDFKAKEIHRITTKGDQTGEGKIIIIPMSRQVETMLNELYALTGETPYVFKSPMTNSHITSGSINKNVRDNGLNTLIVPHGFRHTASTMLNEIGFNADEIELQLNHVIGGVRGVYNKAQKLEQRRKMLQHWSDYLDGIKAGGDVIPINRGTA
ncbi:integrase arm-type DNA-binding domain-containing protein [Thiomicrorhabdus sp. 6S2-11]|uniref:Integrase arm-type DNA-binding domain-containing protein n=1 Tax=Thiomicrorhabdus marina TaxID=2818442 RepID=A0ABS3Q2W9_9GAMM|nr:integrase arm-type DNA-binding domain-containing protein [Thiomicrorhabdus marina]MBO1926684.1 integrase arm-type DNA-binding domain-containing protein [Thiomicrorhabdus marina]